MNIPGGVIYCGALQASGQHFWQLALDNGGDPMFHQVGAKWQVFMHWLENHHELGVDIQAQIFLMDIGDGFILNTNKGVIMLRAYTCNIK
jgi:hypothetical protein